MKVGRYVIAVMVTVFLVGLLAGGRGAGAARGGADVVATVFARQTAEAEGGSSASAERTPVSSSQDEGNEDRPEGLPSGVVAAEVVGHVDGDKLRVEVGGEEREVLLIGVDAPELDEGPLGECYAEDAAEELEDLAPEGDTVYLLAGGGDDEDNRDRLLRFAWVDDGGEALFVNETTLEEGSASFQAREGSGRYDADLQAAERAARADDAGLWGECGGNHVEITPTPIPPTEPPTIDEAVAEYPPLVDVRELAIRPGELFGDRIAFSGTVLTIRVATPGQAFGLGDTDERGYTVQMQVDVIAPDGTAETVFVGYNGDTTGFFEGSFVSVFGTVVDTQTFENAIGGGVTQPLVDAALIVLG